MGLGGNGDSQGLANSGGLAKRRACETCWTWWRWAGARTCWAGGLGQSAGFARLAVPGRQLDLADSAAARIWWLWGGLALDLYTSGVAHLADKGGIAEFGRLVGQRAPVNCACGGLILTQLSYVLWLFTLRLCLCLLLTLYVIGLRHCLLLRAQDVQGEGKTELNSS